MKYIQLCLIIIPWQNTYITAWLNIHIRNRPQESHPACTLCYNCIHIIRGESHFQVQTVIFGAISRLNGIIFFPWKPWENAPMQAVTTRKPLAATDFIIIHYYHNWTQSLYPSFFCMLPRSFTNKLASKVS